MYKCSKIANYFCSLLLFWQVIQPVISKVEPGHIYSFRSVDGQCMTANPHDLRSPVGVFLGQVSTEVCEVSSKSQKWGVILWSKKEPSSRNYLWLYPRENGLNAITALPDPEEPLPEKNLVEIIPVENSDGKFLIQSVELHQCVLSRGKTNAIAYEPCNAKIKEQQWTVLSVKEDVVESTLFSDFVSYTGAKLMSA